MTTNQTIDGVPRELLESFAEYVSDSPNTIMRARAKELRSLLDSPAKDWLLINGMYFSHAEILAWREKACQEAEAAQPQGEPVAYANKSQLERIAKRPGATHAVFGHPEDGYDVPLYAEQPAPVAVVMPDPTPYRPKGDWSFDRLEGGEIVIRNGRDWTVIKPGCGPAYEQFLYRFCEYQRSLSSMELPKRHGKQSNLKDTQYALGWNACLDEVTRLNK